MYYHSKVPRYINAIFDLSSICAWHICDHFFSFKMLILESLFSSIQPDIIHHWNYVLSHWFCISWLYMICASFSSQWFMHTTKHWSVYGSQTNTDTLPSSSSSTAISSAGNSVCMNMFLYPWLGFLHGCCISVHTYASYSHYRNFISTVHVSLSTGSWCCLTYKQKYFQCSSPYGIQNGYPWACTRHVCELLSDILFCGFPVLWEWLVECEFVRELLVLSYTFHLCRNWHCFV